MVNQPYDDMDRLRRDVVALVRRGRLRLTPHATRSHPDIPLWVKRAVIRFGAGDRPNRGRQARPHTFVCWARHDTRGLLRCIYAIDEHAGEREVVVISVFQED